MEDKYIQRNTFFADLHKAFSFSLLFAVLGISLCFCFDNWQDLIGSFHNPHIYDEYSTTCVHYFIFNSFSFGGVFMNYFSCLLAAVPYAANYSLEKQGGMVIYKISRCGGKNYAFSKLLTASLSGGAVMLLGGLIFIFALSTYLPLVTPNELLTHQVFPYFKELSSGSGLSYFIIILYLASLSGALWASVGMCISAYLPNPYVAVCSPMIIRFSLVEVGRLARIPDAFRLDRLINARGILYSEAATLAIITVIISLVWWICYRLFSKGIQASLDGGIR